MPKAIKKRVTRKTRLKEEEVKSKTLEIFTSLKEKKNVLIIGLSALALAAILAVVFIFYSSSMKKKAYAYEREAYNYYYNINLKNPITEEERWKKALELFQKAIELKSTPSAQFYTGNCYFNLGDYENAIKAYNEFIDKYKSNEEILPLVYQKLVLTYIKNNRDDEAIKTLNTLAQFKNGVFKDTALRLEASYYETKGKHEEAVKKYQELVRDFPTSPWSAEANAKIEMEKGSESKISQTK